MNEIEIIDKSQKNVCDIINYINNLINDLDVEVEFKKVREKIQKDTQAVVPVACKEKATNRELISCKQCKKDEILLIFRPDFKREDSKRYEKFTFKSLNDLKKSGMDLETRILEYYDKISNTSKKQNNQKDVKKEQYKKLYKNLKERLKNISETEINSIVKRRVGQELLREVLLTKSCECKICNMSEEAFLIASHIKPWREATNEDKLDNDNAFLLCPNHDALFDKGFISFDDNGKILISDRVSNESRILLNVCEGKKINLSEGNKKYLKWHRENLFK